MSELTKGRLRACKKQIGGVKTLRLIRNADYDPDSYVIEDGVLVSFPETVFYEWEGDDIEMNETFTEQDGYAQEVVLTVPKQELDALQRILTILDNNILLIVESRLGAFKMVGLGSGVEIKVEGTTGAAKGDFNGYTITFNGQTDTEPPFIENFIGGNYIDGIDVTLGCILSSSGLPSSIPNLVSDCNVLQA